MNELVRACPYYTMFPIDFPLSSLRKARPGNWVLDPFCGRGTTLFAARQLGLRASGVDVSPVAAAVASAMLSSGRPTDVVAQCERVLSLSSYHADVPQGDFWAWAYHEETLGQVAALRRSFLNLEPRLSDAEKLLRLIVLGRLHGPLRKTQATYLSNQMPRTYAPKPAYAVNYWRKREMSPPRADPVSVVRRSAERYLRGLPPRVEDDVAVGDSREYDFLAIGGPYDWVVCSPPYHGMTTYMPDQWLRRWFVGGPPEVDYSREGQIGRGSLGTFAGELEKVWNNAAQACRPGAHLVVRFGAIPSAAYGDPAAAITTSLKNTSWRLKSIRPAGISLQGKRQAVQFLPKTNIRRMVDEIDVEAVLG